MATRQELYDRIQKSSKEEVILEEMLRLGFWPRELGRPEDTREELERRNQLRTELEGLVAREAQLKDTEKLKQELRKKRMQESRERQKETKLRRLRERQERAEAWRARKDHEILYLGEGVSAGLKSIETDLDKLLRPRTPLDGERREPGRRDGDHRRRAAVPELRASGRDRQPLPPVPDPQEDGRSADDLGPDDPAEAGAGMGADCDPGEGRAPLRGPRVP